MPRYYEIEPAFFSAVQIAANGKRTVTTADFVRELKRVNWLWSMKQANEWIEMSVTTFRDVSTSEGDNRTFMLFNPNGGL